MVGNSKSEPLVKSPWRAAAREARRTLLFALWLLAFCGGALTAPAALQFDVFLGYDGIVPQASWFPVVCEIKNDGPPFVGTVELDGGRFNQGQTRRAVVELPTGTLKRFVIPVFSARARALAVGTCVCWMSAARCGRSRRACGRGRQIASSTPLLGALVRTPAGHAGDPADSADAMRSLQPAAARLLPSIFPDNPVVLEGLNCLYLNSEKALDLKVGQVNALLAWLNGGGHLIVGVEQISEITATPWLRSVLPCELNDIQHGAAPSGASGVAAERDLADERCRYAAGNRRGLRSGRPGPRRAPGVSAASPFSDLPDDPAFETARDAGGGRSPAGRAGGGGSGRQAVDRHGEPRARAGDAAAVQPGARAVPVVEESADLLGEAGRGAGRLVRLDGLPPAGRLEQRRDLRGDD